MYITKLQYFSRLSYSRYIINYNKNISPIQFCKLFEPVVKNIMSGKIPKSADIKLSGRGFGSKSSVTSHAADSIPMGAVKMKDAGATADVGWEKSDNSEHFYVKFINWGTIYQPPQEFI